MHIMSVYPVFEQFMARSQRWIKEAEKTSDLTGIITIIIILETKSKQNYHKMVYLMKLRLKYCMTKLKWFKPPFYVIYSSYSLKFLFKL